MKKKGVNLVYSLRFSTPNPVAVAEPQSNMSWASPPRSLGARFSASMKWCWARSWGSASSCDGGGGGGCRFCPCRAPVTSVGSEQEARRRCRGKIGLWCHCNAPLALARRRRWHEMRNIKAQGEFSRRGRRPGKPPCLGSEFGFHNRCPSPWSGLIITERPLFQNTPFGYTNVNVNKYTIRLSVDDALLARWLPVARHAVAAVTTPKEYPNRINLSYLFPNLSLSKLILINLSWSDLLLLTWYCSRATVLRGPLVWFQLP